MAANAAESRHRPILVSAAVLTALGYSWMAGHFTTFTRPAEVATFVPGLIGVAVAARVRPADTCRPDRQPIGWAAWWLIVLGFTALELVSLALGSTHAHPTVSDLVNPWLLSTPSRAAGFAIWLGLGYWLARR